MSVQPLMVAGPRLVMVTVAVKPLFHWLSTRYATEQPVPVCDEDDGDADGDFEGDADADGDFDGDAEADGDDGGVDGTTPFNASW